MVRQAIQSTNPWPDAPGKDYMKIAFDIGGVISKYPEIFIPLMYKLHTSKIEVHIITDMHDRAQTLKMLAMNGIDFIPENRIHNSDYTTHGELCKSVILKELEIDIIIDDHIGYVASEGCPVRLLVMPDPIRDYYSEDWITDGSEGNFGRRRKGNPA